MACNRLRSMAGPHIRAGVLALLVGTAACAPRRSSLPSYTEQEYRLGREDVIEVVVYGDGSLGRTLPIRPDGKITLPLCGELAVAGLTAREAAALIDQRLRPWLQDPRVSVLVREANSARVFVLGEVHAPGAFPLRSRTTLLTALANAGGLTEWAHAGRIVVLRPMAGGVQRIRVNLDDALDGEEEATFELAPGDTVWVP